MIKSTAQADAKLRDLAERLQRKIEGSASIDTVRELRDADGWPMLILSDAANEAAGEPVNGEQNHCNNPSLQNGQCFRKILKGSLIDRDDRIEITFLTHLRPG